MALAVRAAVLAAHVAQHPDGGGDDVELLARHLAEAFEFDPVVRAGALVVGQRGALRLRAPMGRDLGARGAVAVLRRTGLGLVEQHEMPVGECPRMSLSGDGAKRRASSRRTCSCKCSILASRRAMAASCSASSDPQRRKSVVCRGIGAQFVPPAGAACRGRVAS